jgi:ribonuclease P protein component
MDGVSGCFGRHGNSIMQQAENKDGGRRYRFGKRYRVLKSEAFRQVFDHRHSAADGRLVVYARPNGLEVCRLGVAVGKAYGSAIRRNRLKRVIREAFRLSRHELPAGYDFVVLPRTKRQKGTANKDVDHSGTVNVCMEPYRTSLVYLCHKLHQGHR